MTHSQLVEAAAIWLRKRCSVLLTEIATSFGEQPDAIGWHGNTSHLIECKTSRADFLCDADKFFRRWPEKGIGSRRYFLAEPGVIPVDKVIGWGVLELTGAKVRQVKPSELFTANRDVEIGLLLSTLRRIGQAPPKGVSIRAYTYETQNRASLGVELDSRLGFPPSPPPDG